ncbi:MAG: GLPGLI family protein [Muribaculaceae bacterium]|nr:GLPGLI family protein [Muribaculaceae bacterium]
MKGIITSIFVCCALGIASARNHAEIEVGYVAHTPSHRDGITDLTNQYILLANSSESKFYSPMTEYIDSLNSTPEGKAKYQEMTRNAYFGGKLDQLPRKDGSFYVVKSFPGNKLVCYDNAGLERYFYEEEPDEWCWKVSYATKEILGYECIEASTDFHGRKWTVWFSPEIPVQNGPWKLDGLPGLILEAESEGGQYRFVATGIQQTDKDMTPIYLADEYERTSRVDFLKAKRAFLDNPLGKIEARFGGNSTAVSTEDENGNPVDRNERIYVTREVVDFIETDY